MSEIADFSLLPPFACIWYLFGVTPLEFRRGLWHKKTRIPGLLYGVVSVIMFSQFDTILACNGQMDGRTHGHTTTAYTALA